MGWHADSEPELGMQPVIASVSLGVARTFDLRHNKTGVVQSFSLKGGSLLVMKGTRRRIGGIGCRRSRASAASASI